MFNLFQSSRAYFTEEAATGFRGDWMWRIDRSPLFEFSRRVCNENPALMTSILNTNPLVRAERCSQAYTYLARRSRKSRETRCT